MLVHDKGIYGREPAFAPDAPLPLRNFDHLLSGEWNDHRDYNIRPDPVHLSKARRTEPGVSAPWISH